jgi:hypothetical protein
VHLSREVEGEKHASDVVSINSPIKIHSPVKAMVWKHRFQSYRCSRGCNTSSPLPEVDSNVE